MGIPPPDIPFASMSDFQIESLEQLLAVALSTERDAVERYSAISRQMQDGGNEELAELFADIAQSERDHVKEIEKMIRTLGIEDLPESPRIPWQHPLVYDYQDLATSPRTSTPYLALAYAVNNEELAFRFYSYVAANTKDDEIRKFAEVFAQEELSHAALFRERRRRAFHEQRNKTHHSSTPAPDQIHFVKDLLAASTQIEQRIHRLLIAAGDLGIDISDSLEKTSTLIEALGQELAELTGERDNMQDTSGNSGSEEATFTGETVRRQIAIATEQAFEFYDSVMEASRDEEVMLKAQELTQNALDRIKTLVNSDQE